MQNGSDFEVAIEYVLQNEGGYVNNPSDPGGATNFGITQRLLDQFTGGGTDVATITTLIAKQVYKKFFWDALNLSQVNQCPATAILDMAVNMGQVPAIKYAQNCCGFAATDGIMGPKTIASLNALDNDGFIYHYLGFIQEHYIDINNPPFLKGWLARSRRMILLIQPV